MIYRIQKVVFIENLKNENNNNIILCRKECNRKQLLYCCSLSLPDKLYCIAEFELNNPYIPEEDPVEKGHVYICDRI